MLECKIEKGIPIPLSRNEKLTGINLDKLEVGYSLTVPKQRRGSLSTAIRRQKYKCPGQNFTTRLIDKTTIRVWRTA